jgi:hypothetical protein
MRASSTRAVYSREPPPVVVPVVDGRLVIGHHASRSPVSPRATAPSGRPPASGCRTVVLRAGVADVAVYHKKIVDGDSACSRATAAPTCRRPPLHQARLRVTYQVTAQRGSWTGMLKKPGRLTLHFWPMPSCSARSTTSATPPRPSCLDLLFEEGTRCRRLSPSRTAAVVVQRMCRRGPVA